MASVHGDVAAEKTFRATPGAGGSIAAPSELERVQALNWASNLGADSVVGVDLLLNS